MTTPGYDPSTWLFNPDGVVFPDTPERRRGRLRSVAAEEADPQVSVPDRGRSVGGAIDVPDGPSSGAVRTAARDACVAAGTGNKLVDLASILMNGREAPVISLMSGATRSGSAPAVGRRSDAELR
jgi:hypothetical protein